jgi:hypothetical protein
MRNRSPILLLAGAAFLGMVITFARAAAAARACSAASACPVGFACLAADAGQGSTCVSQPCQSNSDCGTGFSCYQDITCVPGPDASSVPANLCVPQWQGQCTTDSDCGAGAHCAISGQACDCSGKEGGIPPDAEVESEPCSEAQPPGPLCASDAGCPTFPSVCDAASTCLCWGITRWCQVDTTSCSSASSCLTGWTCSSGTCAPPNSDLAYQGGFGGGTLVCGAEGSGGIGGSFPGLPGPGGVAQGDSGGGTGDGVSGSTDASKEGDTATGATSGGCAIGAAHATGESSSSIALVCLLAGLILRRRRATGIALVRKRGCPSAMRVKFATLLTVAALGACGQSAPSSAQGGLGDPNVLAELRTLALQASAADGVPSPKTMIAVYSPDDEVAQKILTGDIVNDQVAVYVIEVTGGPFTCQSCSTPSGASPPQGNALTITVNAQTFQTTDFGITSNVPDLTQISPDVVNLAQ